MFVLKEDTKISKWIGSNVLHRVNEINIDKLPRFVNDFIIAVNLLPQPSKTESAFFYKPILKSWLKNNFKSLNVTHAVYNGTKIKDPFEFCWNIFSSRIFTKASKIRGNQLYCVNLHAMEKLMKPNQKHFNLYNILITNEILEEFQGNFTKIKDEITLNTIMSLNNLCKGFTLKKDMLQKEFGITQYRFKKLLNEYSIQYHMVVRELNKIEERELELIPAVYADLPLNNLTRKVFNETSDLDVNINDYKRKIIQIKKMDQPSEEDLKLEKKYTTILAKSIRTQNAVTQSNNIKTSVGYVIPIGFRLMATKDKITAFFNKSSSKLSQRLQYNYEQLRFLKDKLEYEYFTKNLASDTHHLENKVESMITEEEVINKEIKALNMKHKLVHKKYINSKNLAEVNKILTFKTTTKFIHHDTIGFKKSQKIELANWIYNFNHTGLKSYINKKHEEDNNNRLRVSAIDLFVDNESIIEIENIDKLSSDLILINTMLSQKPKFTI